MAPPWLLTRGLPAGRVSVAAVQADVGVVQSDGLTFHLGETLEALRRLEGEMSALARREVAFLRRSGSRLVVTDASPFPMRWAAQAGIPGVVVANFGWDAIYRHFARRHAAFERHADAFEAAYGAATEILRLPMTMRRGAFARGRDLPLVVRTARRSAASVRRALGLDGATVVFVSFGGFSIRDLALPALARLGRYAFVVPARGRSPHANVHFVHPERLDHPSLVRAADVVLGKPGYGLVAEVTAFQRRMVYTSRGPFPEYPVLARWLRRTGQAVYVPRADLARGRLGGALARALTLRSASRRPPRTDGAAVAARLLAGYLA